MAAIMSGRHAERQSEQRLASSVAPTSEDMSKRVAERTAKLREGGKTGQPSRANRDSGYPMKAVPRLVWHTPGRGARYDKNELRQHHWYCA